MCGIAGIVGTTPDTIVDPRIIRLMCQAIVHRGPDEEGAYVKDSVGLGMRRLSIIDLAGGRQPIHNEDKTVWVVFNGEIYNFPELRPELEARGHRFYTNSDTEVIVHLYEDLGSDCVQKLRGMFAFALYDERRRSLLIARDRLGKKPLHYALVQGRLFFGSEIKAILAAAPELRDLNREALLKYFYFGYIPAPETAFARIHKLPPGYLLEFAKGQIKIRQYWNLPTYGTHEPPSEEECLEELDHRLAEAVRIRLISDVPLGALLSGGVDSSIVVGLMARAHSGPVRTFSIGFSKQDFNEADSARKVAKRFGTDHHELVVEANIGETLEFLTHHLEEPFGDSSMLPTYFVCKMARQHVTVALAGDGGTSSLQVMTAISLISGVERSTLSPAGQAVGIVNSSIRGCRTDYAVASSHTTFPCLGKSDTWTALHFSRLPFAKNHCFRMTSWRQSRAAETPWISFVAILRRPLPEIP
jgi:asparagine synthase (glutamine-hydrolysing)